MTPSEYLNNKLKLLSLKFPNIYIKYGFNESIETHIVELLPLTEYNNNKDLDNAWIPFSLEFHELFINEEIAFISSDSTLSVKNIIFEFNSILHSEENIFKEIFAGLTSKMNNYTYPKSFYNSNCKKTNINIGLYCPIENKFKNSSSPYSYELAA